jgi:hypothetical protein
MNDRMPSARMAMTTPSGSLPAGRPDGDAFPALTLAAVAGRGTLRATADQELVYDFVISAVGGRGVMRTPNEAGGYELRYKLGGAVLDGSPITGRTKLRVVR